MINCFQIPTVALIKEVLLQNDLWKSCCEVANATKLEDTDFNPYAPFVYVMFAEKGEILGYFKYRILPAHVAEVHIGLHKEHFKRSKDAFKAGIEYFKTKGIKQLIAFPPPNRRHVKLFALRNGFKVVPSVTNMIEYKIWV